MTNRKHAIAAGAALCAAIAVAASTAAPVSAAGAHRAPAYAGLNLTPAWERVGGDFCAKRIAIGEPEHPYVTVCGANDDTQVYRLNNAGTFESVPGAIGASVAPYTDGSMGFALITGDRRLLQYSKAGGLGADQSNTCVRELSSGGPAGRRWDWMIGCPQWPDGWNFPIARRVQGATIPGTGAVMVGGGDRYDSSFHAWPGAAVRVTTGLNDSVAWVVNSINTGGGIYRQNYCKQTDVDETPIQETSPFCKNIPEGWEQIPGCARAIANGGRNQVWIIGCDTDVNGEGSVFQYAGLVQGPIAANRWTKRLGRAKEIAVDQNGRAWLVKADGSVWRWKLDVPGKSQAIETDPRGPSSPNPN